jgi:hypothetical protein
MLNRLKFCVFVAAAVALVGTLAKAEGPKEINTQKGKSSSEISLTRPPTVALTQPRILCRSCAKNHRMARLSCRPWWPMCQRMTVVRLARSQPSR